MRVNYIDPVDHGAEYVTTVAHVVGFPTWDGRPLALVSIVIPEGSAGAEEGWTFATDDTEYVRFLEDSLQAGAVITHGIDVLTAKFPVRRRGWPGDWMPTALAAGLVQRS
jgi:hypothetical protein